MQLITLRKKSNLLLLLIPFLLSGCLSLDGLTSAGASTAGSVIGTSLGGPAVGAVLGLGAGVGADALIKPTANINNYRGADGVLSFTELLAYAWNNFMQNIIMIGIAITIFFVVTTWFGARIPRGEEKMLKKLLDEKIKKEESR